MRHCPNPECPFRKKFGRAGEYRAGFATCSDCGATLVDGAEPAPAAAPAAAPASVASDAGSRLKVTAIVMIAVAIAVQLPMIGITWFDRKPGGLLGLLGSNRSQGLFDIGLGPFFSAFQIVELIALLPFLAARRVGTRAQRRPLTTAAMALGLVLLAAQAASVNAWAQSLQRGAFGTDYPVAQVEPWLYAALLAPTLLLIGAVWLVDQRGLGNGFAVVVAGTAVSELVVGAARAWQQVLTENVSVGQLLVILVLLGTIGAAMVWLTAWRAKPSVEAPTWVPLPLLGIDPLIVAGAVMSLPATLGSWVPELRSFEELLRSSPALYDGAFAFVTFDVTLLFGLLFLRPARVRAEWVARLPAVSADKVHDAARRALPRALGVTVAVVGLAVLASIWMSSVGVALSLAGGMLFTLAGLVVFGDLADEWRARQRLGVLSVATAVYRVTEVEPVLAALQQAGIEAHAKSARYRSLLRFFGPYVPVEILVPAARVAEAKALVERA